MTAWGLVAGSATPGWAAPASALEPAGREAAVIADLFWWMALGSAGVWLAAVGFLLYCLRPPRRPVDPQVERRRLVAGGGVVLPTVLLAVLIGNALPPLAGLVDAPPVANTADLRVRVTGEQWWWRVQYPDAADGAVELANEVRLPLGRRAHVELASDNVIHAFWVPSLAGKVEMIPGRTIHLTLEPTRLGTFRGLCAESCGTSHARMAFEVVVMAPDAFTRWLAAQRAEAAAPASEPARHGAAAFDANGCGSCHTVRGTAADGAIGPDLTHVASRYSLASAAGPAGFDNLEAWLRQPNHRKPGALMPPFAALGDDRLRALTAYLRELR